METVLLVEDVADNARLFERILRAYGFDVVRTEDAASGFRTAVAVHPDIILVDLGLPDVDGLTLVSWLRRVPELARTPIVALTAWPREIVKHLAEAYGCDGYISKPISATRFAHDVAEYLRR